MPVLSLPDGDERDDRRVAEISKQVQGAIDAFEQADAVFDAFAGLPVRPVRDLVEPPELIAARELAEELARVIEIQEALRSATKEKKS